MIPAIMAGLCCIYCAGMTVFSYRVSGKLDRLQKQYKAVQQSEFSWDKHERLLEIYEASVAAHKDLIEYDPRNWIAKWNTDYMESGK